MHISLTPTAFLLHECMSKKKEFPPQRLLKPTEMCHLQKCRGNSEFPLHSPNLDSTFRSSP